MTYEQALPIAQNVLNLLKPHCYRVEIAGSIRRRKAEVKDIEIVAIPKYYNVGMFESGIATVINRWEKVKGELPCRYTQRMLPEGIKVDIFFADPDNWGFILAIRTGSMEFNQFVLGKLWVAAGYHSVDGYLRRVKDDMMMQVSEERQFFHMIGLEWREPWERN